MTLKKVNATESISSSDNNQTSKNVSGRTNIPGYNDNIGSRILNANNMTYRLPQTKDASDTLDELYVTDGALGYHTAAILVIILCVHVIGIWTSFLVDRSRRDTFLETRNCIRARIRLERENYNQVRSSLILQCIICKYVIFTFQFFLSRSA